VDPDLDPAILEQQETQNNSKNDDWSRGPKNVKSNEDSEN